MSSTVTFPCCSTMATFLSNGYQTTIKIPYVEQADSVIVYHVSVQVAAVCWQVQHRYSEFVELHDRLVADHGVNKDLLPPKKVIGNKDPTFIEKRRAGLETYLMSIVRFLQKTMPRELALFLDFHVYDIIFLLQNLALHFFTKGDSLLQGPKFYNFTPLQLHAISERLKQPCPPLEVTDKRLDFSHVLDFCCQLKGITIKGTNIPVGSSNIVPNKLMYELSAFKAVEKLILTGVQMPSIYSTGTMRETVITLNVHYTRVTKISHILLCDDLHKDMSCTNEWHIWKKITEADFSHNDIEEIDESVRLMPNLVHLNLNNNKISSLNNLTSLPHMSHLYLSSNLLSEAENLHTKMGNIVFIDLSCNNIKSLQGFSKLYSLESLDISSNEITDLSEIKYLCGLPCLENLVLIGNPVAIIIDYRVKILEQFGNKAAELCLDNEKSSQKELDTAAVLQALRIVKEGRTPTFETKLLSFPPPP